MLTVTNNHGRIFNVRLVREGDRYGRNDCLVHEETGAGAMVEFYDATYANEPRFLVVDSTAYRGQFVSRYYAATLIAVQVDIGSPAGLALHGGTPEWQVSAENMREVLIWLADQCTCHLNGYDGYDACRQGCNPDCPVC